MANYGYVKSRKTIKPEQVSAMLESINQSKFKGNLTVEYHKATPENSGWGEHTWVVKYSSNEDKQEYARRVCWLETKRSFGISHGGGGGDFAWWLDFTISNEVALLCDGNITDDGDGGYNKTKGKPDYYPTFIDFIKMMKGHVKDPNIQLWLLQEEMKDGPPEHRVDLGPEVQVQINWGKDEE